MTGLSFHFLLTHLLIDSANLILAHAQHLSLINQFFTLNFLLGKIFLRCLNSMLSFQDWLLIDKYINTIRSAYVEFTNSTITRLEHIKMFLDYPNLLLFETALSRVEFYVEHEAVSMFEQKCQHQIDNILRLVPEDVKLQHPTIPKEFRLLKSCAADLFCHYMHFDFCEIRRVTKAEIKKES